MRSIGFSTGALALGDFDKGLALMADRHTSVIELSALREEELPALMGALDRLHLYGYRYVSVHAPSRLRSMKEAEVANLLETGLRANGFTATRTTDKVAERKPGAPAGTYRVTYLPPAGDQTAGPPPESPVLPRPVTVEAKENDLTLDFPGR